jgi:hypothetical protein
MVENKCYRCAELEGCYAGRHGEGKANCKGFCPCLSNEPCIIVEKSEDWIRLIDRTNLNIIREGHSLNPEEVLSALNMDFRVIEKD